MYPEQETKGATTKTGTMRGQQFVINGTMQMRNSSKGADKIVSECLDLGEAPYLQSVLDAIDTVHTDGALLRIYVLRDNLSAGVGGFYDDMADPPRITVARQTLNADLSFLHEVGHYIDHQGIDRTGEYASLHSPLLENWRNVVHQSQSIAEIEQMRFGASLAAQRAFDYLLSDHEIFARCYAQYIAFKSQHPGLVACLRDDFLNHSSSMRRIRQWQEADFTPIAEEIDNVFKRLGWIP